MFVCLTTIQAFIFLLLTTIQSFMFLWYTQQYSHSCLYEIQKNYNQRSTHDRLVKIKRTKEHAMN
jgi:hypothetical protein